MDSCFWPKSVAKNKWIHVFDQRALQKINGFMFLTKGWAGISSLSSTTSSSSSPAGWLHMIENCTFYIVSVIIIILQEILVDMMIIIMMIVMIKYRRSLRTWSPIHPLSSILPLSSPCRRSLRTDRVTGRRATWSRSLLLQEMYRRVIFITRKGSKTRVTEFVR